MTYVVLLFGTLTTIAGVVLLSKPEYILDLLKKYSDSFGIHVVAVIVRIFIGVALIFSAPASRFPLALQVLGGLFILAALVLAVIGRSRFKSLMTWAMNLAHTFGRVSGIFAVMFGGFLCYAVY